MDADVIERDVGRDASSVLRMRNVVRIREGADTRFELHVPDFNIPKGAFAAVVGSSGCGKSTLLDMLGLIMRPSEAEIFEFRPEPAQNAIDLSALWERREETVLANLRRQYLGYVLQTGGLFPFLTAEENIGIQAQLVGRTLSKERIRADAERLDIASVLRKKPAFLSGGQRQRTAILRALSNDPAIVLADEPTAAVDEERARQIFADFNDLARRKNATVVVVTHSPDLVLPYADLVFRFDVGSAGNAIKSTCFRAKQ